MKLIIEIDKSRFKNIQRIAEVQLERGHFQTAEQIIAKGVPLEQEPCEDAISRQAVEDAIAETIVNGESLGYTVAYDILSDLPPVTPEPKTGQWWTRNTYPQECECWDCSECKETVFEQTNYCPHCGAKMERG